MAFINIEDPKKREDIVRNYIKTRNAIRERNESNKENILLKQQELQEKFRPLVQATEKLPEKIVHALEKETRSYPIGDDNHFGIYESNGSLQLGKTPIELDKDILKINGKEFQTTSGLWELISEKAPQQYTSDHLEAYKKIINLTDLLNNPIHTHKNSHKNTKKYKFLKKIVEPEIVEIGEGIILPADINSLKHRLQLVCAERAAGNIQATTSEIVAILDEFLRRGHITKPEYNVVCKRLQC